MAEIVIMPKLGFDMAEGVLVRWAVAPGETIAKGQLLAEIETDKATVEVESSYSGVVAKHLVEEKAVVPVNTPIAIIAQPGETVDLAALGLGGEEKAESSVKGEESGEKRPERGEERAEVRAEPIVEPPAEGGQFPDGVRATPLARRLAQANRVNLGMIRGSGPQGRIVKKDVEAYLAGGAREAAIESRGAGVGRWEEKVETSEERVIRREVEQVPLTKLRQAIGRRMTESKQTVPHFYVTFEYDMGPVMELRQQINALLEGTGEKLSVNDFLMKAVALCLKEFPNLNASLGEGEVIRHGQVNIGVAVAVEGGLLTIAHKDTDLKPVRQIAAEVKGMVDRARAGKVRPEDIEGSTFSISNLGMFGVDEFVAIINPPEAAILAVGAAKQVPVVENGQLGIGWRMRATISVDHRVSDGAEAAQFMQALAKYIEQPLRLMM